MTFVIVTVIVVWSITVVEADHVLFVVVVKTGVVIQTVTVTSSKLSICKRRTVCESAVFTSA